LNKKIVYLILIIVFGLGLVLSQNYLKINSKDYDIDRDVYIPNSEYLRFISLGNKTLISDIVLAKALTYYGSHYFKRKEFKFKNLKRLFRIAGELDNRNSEAFLMGNNLLTDVNVDDGIELLNLARLYDYRYWKYPEMIGFDYFYYKKDNIRAARYYEIASQLPNHPPYVPSLSSKFYEESGRYKQAIGVLYNFYLTTKDKRLKKSFKKSIEIIEQKLKNSYSLLKAKIVNVIDGDSFVIEKDLYNPYYKSLSNTEEIRLIGINSFEMRDKDNKKRLFAHLQRDFFYFHLNNRTVYLEFEKNSIGEIKRDRYNRLLCYLYTDRVKKEPFQLIALKLGFTNGFYKYRFKKEYYKMFRKAEREAKKNKKGIFSFPPKIVRLSKIADRIGDLSGVIFRVRSVKFTSKNIYLNAPRNKNINFSVVIPLKYAKNFTRRFNRYFRRLRGRKIKVYGFTGIYKNNINIRLYFPLQLLILR